MKNESAAEANVLLSSRHFKNIPNSQKKFYYFLTLNESLFYKFPNSKISPNSIR